MYKTIYVPVDNSDYSNRAVETAVELGKAFDSKLVGCHVYAASMHDYRFKQMEYTLPEEYLDETELERQRKIHDSLITMGLKLISDSYLEQMSKKCQETNLEFVPKMMDGKHHVEIVKDIEASGYDLVVMGAAGIGRARDTQIGSVCERVTRSCNRDIWVIKHLSAGKVENRDSILVGIDGSPQSFGALMTAIDLARRFDKTVELIGVYDPYLHYAVFNGIVGVLTEKAAKVFRFEEQNQLHEEIIDTGLAQIYQSHLDVAERMARDEGVEVVKTLLDGKCFQKILDHVRKTNPWLLAIGRIGVHSPKEETALGSNAENLLRSCPCDVLLTTRLEYPRIDVKAEESIRWTPEAEERMKRVPNLVKGIARTGILRLAVEKGHSVVTNAVIDEAMDRFMPRYTADVTAQLAEAVALERARAQPIAMCRRCGVTAAEPEPVRCAVCGSADFEAISREMIERIASVEGGLAEEATYDGRKLRWTEEAKRALWTMKDAYQRRRTKARVEKSARMKRTDVVTLEFARRVIEEETGAPFAAGASASSSSMEVPPAGADDGPRLIARDDKNNPVFSTFTWIDDATQRLLRVPAGFMRSKTQERIEALARDRCMEAIDLPLVEAGIEIGRQIMMEMLSGREDKRSVSEAPSRVEESASPSVPHPAASGGSAALNEVGTMSVLEAKRNALKTGSPGA